MPTVSVTPRTFQPGANAFSRNVPGNFDFQQLDIDIDYSSWTSPATTGINLKIEISRDNGLTWWTAIDTGQSWPLEFRGHPITHGTATLNYTYGNAPAALRVTNVRLTLTVFGAPVVLSATIVVT